MNGGITVGEALETRTAAVVDLIVEMSDAVTKTTGVEFDEGENGVEVCGGNLSALFGGGGGGSRGGAPCMACSSRRDQPRARFATRFPSTTVCLRAIGVSLPNGHKRVW